jgi:hypothetical protein
LSHAERTARIHHLRHMGGVLPAEREITDTIRTIAMEVPA